MKLKLKYAIAATLLLGLSGFHSAKAVTNDDLLVVFRVVVFQIGWAFSAIVQTLDDHESRISDNEQLFQRIQALEASDASLQAQLDGALSKLRASDGALLDTFIIGSFPMGVAFDGANIWVASYFDNTVSKLQASDGALLDSFPVGVNPRGVAFDGVNIWVANETDKSVSKL
ncbi:MAG: hypothetical protein GY875_19025 [Gammaproteobacteria bacterium]|nr:hypothetical protein [Gammaproteobacteria bacterium]